MEWWESPLLLVAAPVLISSFFLWLQGRSNAKATEDLEKQRRLDAEAERGHQERLLGLANKNSRDQAEELHRRESREAWKADRRVAHTRLLARLEEIQATARSALVRLDVELSIGATPTDFDFALPSIPNELLAEVSLLGSDASATAAQKARDKALVLSGAMTVIRIALISNGKTGSVKNMHGDASKAASELDTEITTYRQTAKQDIDTTD